MDNPLRYQMTEYDCGPTSMLNAVSYLFRRDEIPPELTRKSCCTVWTASARTAARAGAAPRGWR